MSDSEMTAIARQYRPIGELIPAHWQEGHFPADDGTPLHYWRTGGGDKPALVLLHGFQSAGLTWLGTARALEADYDVVLFDFRGHGRSGEPDKGFSLDVLTADTAALIGTLGREKPFVMGHSTGAEVAGRLAADYPESVRGVILEEPPMRPFEMPQDEEPSPWLRQWLGYMQALKTQTHAERMVSAAAMMPPGVPFWGEEDFVAHVEAQAQFNLDVLQHAQTMNYGLAQSGRLARIACPILLMIGSAERGSAHDPAVLETLQTVWRDGQVIRFEEAGHFLHAEVFPEFIAAVARFLAAH